MEGNNAPFYVGQKVIALVTGENSAGVGIIKGKVYTVESLMQTSCCGIWYASVGLPIMSKNPVSHCYCSKICEYPSTEVWVRAALLAPVQHQYTDIAREIADTFKQTEEVPDKIINPQPAIS